MRVLLSIFTILISLPFLVSHAIAAPITVDKQTMAIEVNGLAKKPLLSQAIDLQGPSSSRDFYYTLNEDVTTKGHTVSFQIQHSELLIAPSSFTIKVDNTALKSIPLTSDTLKQTVTVSLPESALKKGSHKITASFYGILKEGVCVAPGNDGNWLRIDILSSISFVDDSTNQWTLSSYPEAFVGYEDYQTILIVPDKASQQTLNASYQLAAYLSERGDKDVDVKRESAVARVTGPVIVVGAKDEFSTNYMIQMLNTAKVQYEDGLTLSMHSLKNEDSNQSVPLLFVSASSANALQERITLLTDAKLFSQFAGSTLTVDQLPSGSSTNESTVLFSQLGFNEQTLSSQVTETPHYYVSLPALEPDKEANMRLLLKKSTLLPEKGQDNEREVELIVWVNAVPHAVDLQNLESASSDLYEVNVPIQTNVMNKQSLTDIQFEVTGFQLEDPCETTNERYWLYIDESSSLTLTKEAITPTFTLRDFPNAFHEQTLIIVPNNAAPNDMQMLLLYKALMMNGENAQTLLKKEQDVTDEELKQHAVIFVGASAQFSKLIGDKNDVGQSTEDFLQQGFLPETIAQHTFITQSFWNDKQPLLVIQTMDAAANQKDFLAQLKGTNEKVSAAIETKEGKFIVAAKSATDSKQSVSEQQNTNVWMLIVEFALLIIVIGIILYFILRRKRKNQLVEDEEV
ncbi:cellulose biosynthesis cyclic di-GMP-binding regulatory protein BcsB [Lysinibacillus sp. NPDC097195]|uniref:cellulose biosynthesis cyclic di-GMP-binding regulatory protein BcsB n=1 Tax=Lysinibacillus sp. NPDC097195 TaxID=3364141 RepID=UPI0037F2F4EA